SCTPVGANRRSISHGLGAEPRRQATAKSGPANFRPSANHTSKHKKCKQKKSPGQMSGPLTNREVRDVPQASSLLVLFGLLFRRCQALEALEEFFLGHALGRDLGVVGIDAGASRADQRDGIGIWLGDAD